MPKTEIIKAAQDECLQGLTDSFNTEIYSTDNINEQAAIRKEMSVQMARVETLFGYIKYSWSRG